MTAAAKKGAGKGAKPEARFFDFDAARREKRKTPARMRVLGEDVDLPGAMPAWLAFEVARMEAEHGADFEPEYTVVETWLKRLCGSERVDRWLDELDIEEITMIFQEVFNLLMFTEPEAGNGDGGEDDAPGEG